MRCDVRITIFSSSDDDDDDDGDGDDCGGGDGDGDDDDGSDDDSENDERDRLMRVRSKTSQSGTCEIAMAFLSKPSTTTIICVRNSRRCLSQTMAIRNSTYKDAKLKQIGALCLLMVFIRHAHRKKFLVRKALFSEMVAIAAVAVNDMKFPRKRSGRWGR
jgi:hypothetical protein